MRGMLCGDARDDLCGLSSGELRVKDCSRDADSLLAPGLLKGVELRSVEKPREDVWDLLFYDARPIVLDDHAVLEFPNLNYLNRNLWQDPRFLARVDGVINSLLDRHKERFSLVVKSKKVPILGEELSDRDLLLPLGKLHCNGFVLCHSRLVSFLFKSLLLFSSHL